MNRFPQPPDEPEEGNCSRCKRWITRDELLTDGCTECDDLLINDMRTFWNGRPKVEPKPFKTGYVAVIDNRHAINITFQTRIEWRGLL